MRAAIEARHLTSAGRIPAAGKRTLRRSEGSASASDDDAPSRSRCALRQLRRAAGSGRRSALRGRCSLVAGQVRDLAWSQSLLARLLIPNGDLRTASRHSCLNARRARARAIITYQIASTDLVCACADRRGRARVRIGRLRRAVGTPTDHLRQRYGGRPELGARPESEGGRAAQFSHEDNGELL
jgi:hypothetical protein